MSDFYKIDRIVALLILERERELTPEEQQELSEWLAEDDNNRKLYDSLKDKTNIEAKIGFLNSFDKQKAYDSFLSKINKSKTRTLTRQILKYAAVLIPFFVVIWFVIQRNNVVEQENNLAKTEIQPIQSKAVLRLADGKTILLEEEKDLIVELGCATIINNDKEIVYNRTDKAVKTRKLQYNTIEIPRGGEYQITLSDGTKVWLNSSTSLKYPVAFAAGSRDVYLQGGEVFFDVAKNKDRPFIVHTSKMNVNVLGTMFNIRDYSDENRVTTTLVEGKVLINNLKNKKDYTLTPNEQAVVSDSKVSVETVDVSRFIAWKNGRILFKENTLDEIFNDLARWYDIDFNFENQDAAKLRFSIDIERYDELSEILEIIELTQKVKIEVNDNLVIIK